MITRITENNSAVTVISKRIAHFTQIKIVREFVTVQPGTQTFDFF